MNNFSKSILNYFAAFSETRFNFQTKVSYRWTDNHLTCDFPIFPSFQQKILKSIKDKKSIDLKVSKGEYTISLDSSIFVKRIIEGLENQYSLEFLNELINNITDEYLEEAPLENRVISKEVKAKILTKSYREFNLELREYITEIILEMQEVKKKELSHLIKDMQMPVTTFNPKILTQSIYDKIAELAIKSNSPEEFYLSIVNYISETTWDMEMYDLYSMLTKFSAMIKQTMGSSYIFFHDLSLINDNSKNKFPLFLMEVSITVSYESVEVKSERGIVYINTSAINSFSFESILTTPRAVRVVDAPDYIYGIEKYFQSQYDFYNTFILEQGFQSIVGEKKPKISFRIGMQIVQKEDKKLLDYSELITRIDAGKGGKFIDFVGDYVSGNVKNTVDEVNTEYLKKYPPRSSNSILSTIPLNLNDRQKRILIALENPKNRIIVIDGPPGTGKSYVIMAMMYWANKNNKSVVITSHKKAAIDVIDNMATERFKKLHPKSKPSILRICNDNSLSLNNYKNTFAMPAISAATNRFNEFDEELVNKDIEEIRKTIIKQADNYRNNEKGYKNRIENILKLEEIERSLFEKGIIAEEDRPIKSSGQLIDINRINDYIQQTIDNNTNFTVEELKKLIEYKESIPKMIEECEILNNLKFDMKDITKLNIINISLINEFSNIISYIEPHIKKETKLATGNIIFGLKMKFLTPKKQSEIENKIKDLLSLRFEYLWDNITMVIKKDRKEIDVSELKNALADIKEIEISRQSINYFNTFSSDLNLTGKNIKEVYGFLQNNKEIAKLTTQELLDHIIYFLDKYGDILKKVGLNTADLNSLKSLFGKSDSYKEILNYITFFENMTENDIAELPKQKSIELYYETIKRQIENQNDKRLKNLNNYIGDKSRIEATFASGKRLTKAEAEVVLKNISCILSEPDLLSQYLPMEEDLIDILIIDEASQVSIAQSISLILRAKQVVVLGDDLQYGAVSAVNVNGTYNAQYFKEILYGYEKDFNAIIDENQKKKILVDVAKEVDEEDNEVETFFKPEDGTKEWLKTFSVRTSTLNFARALANFSISLDTHFRSFPEIIDYSNEFFYKEKQIPLIVNRIRTKPINEVLRFIKVETKGNAGMNINLDEIDAIKKDIEERIANGYKGTIGIITSFRDQKFEMEKIFRKEMDNFYKLEKEHRLSIWFVADVQGEERDLVYYSFVEDKRIDNGSLRNIYSVPKGGADDIHKFKMQRLNVGFSRAKDTMVFVHSMPIEDYSDTRLGDALKHYKNILDTTVDNYIEDESIFDSIPEKELYKMVINTDFYKKNRDSIKIIAQFPIGKYIKDIYKRYIPNYRVDFLLTMSKDGKEQSLILEYDGVEFHTKNPEIVTEHNFSEEYLDYDINRQFELESYGYRFLRINKFTLIPKVKGQTKIDVLNNLLESKFQ